MGFLLDKKVLTDTGWKYLKDLSVSDKVFDKNGDLIDITNITESYSKCFKVRFDNNDEIICSYDHIWNLYNKQKEIKLTTSDIVEYLKSYQRVSRNLLRLEIAKPLNNKHKDLLIDPYVLGVWLGDGHSIDSKITQANEKVWVEIKNRGYEIGNDISGGGCGKATTRTIFGISKHLRCLNLLKNKHLPYQYLLSSYEQRLDLLRGLMDSDGYYNKLRKRFSISTTRLNQVEFSVQIMTSLGLKTTVLQYNKKLNNILIKCYNVEFSTNLFNPFLSRNQDIILPNNSNSDCRIIKDVVEVGYYDTIQIGINLI